MSWYRLAQGCSQKRKKRHKIRSCLCCESPATAQTSVLKPSVVSTRSRANQMRYNDPTTPNLCMLLSRNRRATAAFSKHRGDLQSAGRVRSLTAPTAAVWLFVSSGASVMQFSCNFCNSFPLLIYFKGFQSLRCGLHMLVHTVTGCS